MLGEIETLRANALPAARNCTISAMAISGNKN
jgi:hypothetical protein